MISWSKLKRRRKKKVVTTLKCIWIRSFPPSHLAFFRKYGSNTFKHKPFSSIIYDQRLRVTTWPFFNANWSQVRSSNYTNCLFSADLNDEKTRQHRPTEVWPLPPRSWTRYATKSSIFSRRKRKTGLFIPWSGSAGHPVLNDRFSIAFGLGLWRWLTIEKVARGSGICWSIIFCYKLRSVRLDALN